MAKENVERNNELCDLMDKHTGDREKIQSHFKIDNHTLRAWLSRLCAKDDSGNFKKPDYATRLTKWMRNHKTKTSDVVQKEQAVSA